jgi:SAM-dependent methyltransferase
MNAAASSAVADQLRVDWQMVPSCPACAAPLSAGATLPDRAYMFGTERIAYPDDGIALAVCKGCGLAAKTVLPAPASLTQVFERQSGNKWMAPYDFADERRELEHWLGGGRIDVLDVGAGNGGLLAALAQRGGGGRRSALDVVQHPGCAEHVEGEFIRGQIDGQSLHWSGQPYDVVTMFDVLEHLYAPAAAFHNLRKLLCNGGLLVIETGNLDSDWPRRFGAHHWWYVRLFEHHVFWSRASLERIAERHGFKLLLWRELRHKARSRIPPWQLLNDSAQVALYRLTPRLYPQIAPLLGKYWTQPWSPWVRDHFRAVLRRL